MAKHGAHIERGWCPLGKDQKTWGLGKEAVKGMGEASANRTLSSLLVKAMRRGAGTPES